jgi:organic radical activating enzyme
VSYRYQNVIIFLNRRCTVGCASCSAAAAAGNTTELSNAWLTEFFNKIGENNLEFSGCIIWTGGEPFLSFAALQTGIALAAVSGYRSEILTGGAWFADRPEYLDKLTAAGNYSLRISLDAEHQEKVPLHLVFSLIRQALKQNIKIDFTLRHIPGRRETIDYYKNEIKKALPEFYRENSIHSRWLHVIPHIPPAHAGLENINCLGMSAANSSQENRKWQKACSQGFRDLVIGEDGFVYPCCGLFSLACYPRLRVGHPLRDTWYSLANNYKNNPLFRALKEKGPFHICRELGFQPETWSGSPYRTACALCLDLFNRNAQQALAFYS